MIAGNETANGSASALTESPGSSASRVTSARRVGSARADRVLLRRSAAVVIEGLFVNRSVK